MNIYYLFRFKESYERLPSSIKKKAELIENVFRDNPFDPRIKTHKLHGKLKNQWSFSINREYRILFEFDNKDVIFLDIGSHKLYKH